MKNDFNKGFTIMELLVVIAIIAILTTVVIASLTTAKRKGEDSAIKSDLSSIRTQANIYYNGTGSGSYGALTSACDTGMYLDDPVIAQAYNHAKNISLSVACNTGPTNLVFAVVATLKSSAGGYYCVDSTNAGKVIPASVATSGLVGSGTTFALNTDTGLCI